MTLSKPFACVDLGTNTCLMLVARRGADGNVEVLADRARIVRLGEGVDRTGELSATAKSRTLECLAAYATEARALGAERLVGVATSAMRDARNSAEFASEILRTTGFTISIIGGDEEAGLAYAAVAADFSVPDQKIAVFDIGGGSTEVMVGQGATLIRRKSIDIGSVRLTERFLKHDPPDATELAALQSHIVQALQGRPELPSGAPLIGIAGTVTTLAACSLDQPHYDAAKVHGALLSLSAVTTLRERFSAVSAQERLAIRPLEPGRADVIVAGALIVECIMRAYGVEKVLVGDRGVRFGLFHAQR